MTARNLGTGRPMRRVIPRTVVTWRRALRGKLKHALRTVGILPVYDALCGYTPRTDWLEVHALDADLWAECPKCVAHLIQPTTHVTRVIPDPGSGLSRWLCTCGGRSRCYEDPAELDRARFAHAAVHNRARR